MEKKNNKVSRDYWREKHSVDPKTFRKNDYGVQLSLEDRVYLNINYTEDCWIWDGTFHPTGHPWIRMRVNGIKDERLVSRLMYQWFKGDIPTGHFVIRTCGDLKCVNPKHLETEKRVKVLERGNAKWRSTMTPRDWQERAKKINVTRYGGEGSKIQKDLKSFIKSKRKKIQAEQKRQKLIRKLQEKMREKIKTVAK